MDKNSIIKKTIIIILVLLTNYKITAQNIPYNNQCGNTDWRVLWYDEFNSLDLNKWEVLNDFDQWGEIASVCIDDNVNIVNGALKLDIKKESYQCPIDAYNNTSWYCFGQKNSSDPNNYYYKFTSGQVKSKAPYDMQYGYTEARIKFPVADGTWSCYWLYGTDGNGGADEVDMAEIWGTNCSKLTVNGLVDQSTTGIHLWNTSAPNPQYLQHHNLPNHTIENYNIYGVYWSPTVIKFYINGALVRTLPNAGIHLNSNIILDAWVEKGYFYPFGNWSVSRFNSFPSQTSMLIDWIRVYEPYTLTIVDKTPYLINPKDDPQNSGKKQMTIMWQLPTGTSSSTVCNLNYGTTSSYGSNTTINDNTTNEHLYSKTLSNLNPNTKYYYSITGGGYNYAGNFITPPNSTSNNTKFYVSGSRIDKTLPTSEQVNNDIAGEILSDISSDPNSQNFLVQTNGFVTANNKEFWRDEFFKYTINGYNLKAKLPIIGPISINERKEKCLDFGGNIIGDKADGNAMNFHTYLPFDYANPYLNNQQDFNYDLSMDYGPVHICFPEITEESFASNDLSLGFIDSDLGSTTRDWKVLSFNFPLKSLNGDIVNSAAYTQIRQRAINNHVQLVLMGHEDYYAHWVDNGIHFLILGNGGSTTNSIDVQKIANDNDLVQASTVPHYAKFHIDGDMMYVDVKQGADYNGYTKGRTIEKFAIPKSCHITNTQSWNTGNYPIVTDYLWVATGGNLKIESEVQLLKDASIKVSKGAMLNLTGTNAKLTSVDAFTENLDLVTKDASGNVTSNYKNNYTKQASYWEGVELNSYPPYNQLDFSNQGVLYVTNGATIENAKVGVAIKQLMLVNGQNVWKGGGILRADQANFVNNITDIKMYPYQGTKTLGSGKIVELADRTRITRSVFKTDNNFLDLSKTPKHIVLQGVRGVLLYGNDFENTNTSLPQTQKGIGIFASESSFNLNNVTHYFLNQTKANTFNNLQYGVKTYNSIGKGNTYIKGCTFTNTNNSIYLDNSYSTSVLGNSIVVPEYNSNASVFPYGIYIDGGNGFKVENNTLSIGGGMPVTFGIVANGTGAYDNQIYKNTLTGFNVAIQPQDENFGFGSQFENIGLHLFCNDYSGVYDNWIGKSPNYTGAVGIAADQQMRGLNPSGVPTTYPAGNKFSTTFRMAAYDYDNTDGNNPDGLYYYYEKNASYNAKPIYTSNIMPPVPLSIANTCPDKSNSGNTPINILTSNLANAQISLNSAKTILAIWKDGGNANLDEEVKTAQPWDVYVEFNHLIAESPYLSDEVLMATIENPAFTSLMIKLIMVANPHASRNEEIMNMIYKRIPAMSEAYINEIKQGSEIESQLDLLKNDVSSNYHLVRMIGEDIKRNYRNDTINGNTIDNLYTFVATQNDLLDKYELAKIELERGNFKQMNMILSDISNNFKLNKQQLINHSDFETTFGVAQTVYENALYIDGLTELQKVNLQNIVARKGSQVSQMALALLVRNNPDYEYTELVLQPSENSARIANKKDNISVDEETLFKVYPNPATDYFTLEYNINKEEYSVLTMEIHDATGRIIKTKNLELTDNALLIDVSSLSKGIYTISFIADTKVLSVKKLTIIR